MKLALRSKIHIALISLLLLFGVGIYVIASRIMSQALLEEYKDRGLLITSNLAAWAVEPMLTMDYLRLKNLVDEAVRSNNDVQYVFILNDRVKVLVHTFGKGFPIELKTANEVTNAKNYSRRLLDIEGGLVYDFAVPILIGQERFGTVRLGLLRTRVTQAINRLSLMMFLAMALFVALSSLIGGVLARAVGKRIESLHQSIEQAMRGNLNLLTAPALSKNCWEIMHCTREECPAYREMNLRCWYVAGTLCPSCVEGEYAKKIERCQKCSVYKACAGDEIQDLAESFDFMARTLRNHLLELEAIGANLVEQQTLLRMVLDVTPDFVSLQDRKSVYRLVNRAFCEIVGKSEDQIVGRTDFDFLSLSRAAENRQEDLSVLTSGKPLMKESPTAKTSEQRWIHLVKLPVRDANGSIVGLLCSGRDITDVKRFQERLTQSQKMEAVGQLTAGIAHEINTPLGIILGYAQLLQEEVDPGSQVHADLKTIEKHAQICRKIVSDLLRFSRHTESRMMPLDINRVIEQALTVVEHTFGLERVRIKRDLGADVPQVVGDEEKLIQAVVNLLNNAFDAIGSDGLIRIATSFEAESGEVLIAVADTGKGILPEHLDKIFDPFFTTKGVGEGTGLGLSVTFGIVKDHGGRIEGRSPLPDILAREINKQGFDSSPVKGTVLTVYLPAKTYEEQAHQEEPNGDYSHIG
jgi:two-component system, NtrC family, sensor kinase